jgi:hypothetical protein
LIRQLLLVAVSLTFQVAILKFIAMHYYGDFIFNNGGASFEALKAVTEKPELHCKSCIIDEDEYRVPDAKRTADLFDKFVPFYSLGFAFQP